MAPATTQAAYSAQVLQQQIEAGHALSFLPFYSAKTSGSDMRGYLSQFYRSEFTISDTTYPSAEHYMMAQKASLFGDDETGGEIMRTPLPGTVKALGRTVKNFDENIWDHHKVDVVFRGNLAKFRQNPALSSYILSTDKAILVEASPHDKIWGIGLPSSHEALEQPKDWLGQNLLGFTLMRVRDALRTSPI